MRIRHEPFGKPLHTEGQVWNYYVDTFFAVLPTFLNTGQAMPGFAWMCRYWQTYPVDANGKVIEAYRVTYASDPLIERNPKE